MQAAGADAFVAGNAIFKHPEGIAAAIQGLRAAGA
jgi:pentose-5-phosphate-3-epimerase